MKTPLAVVGCFASRLSDASELDDLMDEAAYSDYLKTLG